MSKQRDVTSFSKSRKHGTERAPTADVAHAGSTSKDYTQTVINGKHVYVFMGGDGEKRMFRFVTGEHDQMPSAETINQVIPQIKKDVADGKFAPRNIITVRLGPPWPPAAPAARPPRSAPQLTPTSDLIKLDSTGGKLLEASVSAPRTYQLNGSHMITFDKRAVFFTTRNDETLKLKREEQVTLENVDSLKEIDDERKAAGFHGMPVFVWNAVNSIINSDATATPVEASANPPIDPTTAAPTDSPLVASTDYGKVVLDASMIQPKRYEVDASNLVVIDKRVAYFATRIGDTLEERQRGERVTVDNVESLETMDNAGKENGFDGLSAYVWDAVRTIVKETKTAIIAMPDGCTRTMINGAHIFMFIDNRRFRFVTGEQDLMPSAEAINQVFAQLVEDIVSGKYSPNTTTTMRLDGSVKRKRPFMQVVSTDHDQPVVEPVSQGQSNASGGQDSTQMCIICFESYTDADRLSALPCGHLFGGACIAQWIAEHRKCPTCNKKCKIHKILQLHG